MARRLEWTDHELQVLEDVAAVLAVINPRGQTAERMRTHVEREFYRNDDFTSYIGTGGWYITVYQSIADPEVWRPLPTLMPYTVKRWVDMMLERELERQRVAAAMFEQQFFTQQ